jgi:hypothetical protein
MFKRRYEAEKNTWIGHTKPQVGGYEENQVFPIGIMEMQHCK